jgi:GDP-L-fucose synthase
MFYKGKNVLVAGGAGLVGQSLVRKLLEQGAHVRATQYKSRKIALTHKNLEIVSCDLTSDAEARRAFKGIEVVFFSAAMVRGAKMMNQDPSAIILYNLNLHAQLFSLAVEMKVDRCAHVSSSYVYPDTGKPNTESEGFLGDPNTKANAKHMSKTYGLGWLQRYLETLSKHFHATSKTKFAIVRPTTYYGPHDNFNLEECHVIPALIAKAANRMDPFEVWGDGQDVRCFTHVDDLTEGLMLVTEKHAKADPVNICAKQTHDIKDVVRLVLDESKFHPKVVFNSNKPSTSPYKVSDPSYAKKLLNWEAKIELREGLKQTIYWYKEQNKSPSGLSSSTP